MDIKLHRLDIIESLVNIRKRLFNKELEDYRKTLENLTDEKLQRIYNTIEKERDNA